MDGASIARLRWRLHGAWMWPTFVSLTLLDGLLVHWLPISGDAESPISGWLVGVFPSLLAIVIVAPPLGMLLRRLRPDMPKVVARDYAGAATTLAVTLVLAGAGLAHHSTVQADRRAMEDATARAIAYVGTHAAARFRSNLGRATTYEIQAGIYRVCVPDRGAAQTYCVIVRPRLPFARSVSFAGYEPNSVLSRGAW